MSFPHQGCHRCDEVAGNLLKCQGPCGARYHPKCTFPRIMDFERWQHAFICEVCPKPKSKNFIPMCVSCGKKINDFSGVKNAGKTYIKCSECHGLFHLHCAKTGSSAPTKQCRHCQQRKQKMAPMHGRAALPVLVARGGRLQLRLLIMKRPDPTLNILTGKIEQGAAFQHQIKPVVHLNYAAKSPDVGLEGQYAVFRTIENEALFVLLSVPNRPQKARMTSAMEEDPIKNKQGEAYMGGATASLFFNSSYPPKLKDLLYKCWSGEYHKNHVANATNKKDKTVFLMLPPDWHDLDKRPDLLEPSEQLKTAPASIEEDDAAKTQKLLVERFGPVPAGTSESVQDAVRTWTGNGGRVVVGQDEDVQEFSYNALSPGVQFWIGFQEGWLRAVVTTRLEQDCPKLFFPTLNLCARFTLNKVGALSQQGRLRSAEGAGGTTRAPRNVGAANHVGLQASLPWTKGQDSVLRASYHQVMGKMMGEFAVFGRSGPWQRVADALNEEGVGPRRTAEQCQERYEALEEQEYAQEEDPELREEREREELMQNPFAPHPKKENCYPPLCSGGTRGGEDGGTMIRLDESEREQVEKWQKRPDGAAKRTKMDQWTKHTAFKIGQDSKHGLLKEVVGAHEREAAPPGGGGVAGASSSGARSAAPPLAQERTTPRPEVVPAVAAKVSIAELAADAMEFSVSRSPGPADELVLSSSGRKAAVEPFGGGGPSAAPTKPPVKKKLDWASLVARGVLNKPKVPGGHITRGSCLQPPLNTAETSHALVLVAADDVDSPALLVPHDSSQPPRADAPGAMARPLRRRRSSSGNGDPTMNEDRNLFSFADYALTNQTAVNGVKAHLAKGKKDSRRGGGGGQQPKSSSSNRERFQAQLKRRKLELIPEDGDAERAFLENWEADKRRENERDLSEDEGDEEENSSEDEAYEDDEDRQYRENKRLVAKKFGRGPATGSSSSRFR